MGSLYLTLLTIGYLIIVLMIGISVTLYILLGYGLYNLAKLNGFEKIAFLAWIPIAQLYLIAYMAGDIMLFNSAKLEAQTSAILFVLIPIIHFIPIIGYLSYIFYIILGFHIYKALYDKIDPENSILFTILSSIIIPVAPIYIFIKRNTVFSYSDNVVDGNVVDNTNENTNQ